MVVASLISGAAFIGLATMTSAPFLFGYLVLAGIAQGIAQPSTSLMLASASADRFLAFRFAIKQSSIPLATLLAGLTLPVVASTVGWRWAFAGAAAIAFTLTAVLSTGQRTSVPPRTARTVTGSKQAIPGRQLVALAVAAGLSSTAATAVPSFLSHTTDAYGMGAGYAGWLLAFGSLSGVAGRLTWGWLFGTSERRALGAVGTMMAVGALGYVLLGAGTEAGLVAGTLLAFSFGWGWPGLFQFTLVVLNPRNPGRASGIGQAGAASGAAVGPLAFGLAVSSVGYNAAWMAAAVIALSAGAVVLTVLFRLRNA